MLKAKLKIVRFCSKAGEQQLIEVYGMEKVKNVMLKDLVKNYNEEILDLTSKRYHKKITQIEFDRL